MFFQQAFKGANDWWRYIAVTIIVFIGYQIGTIPLLLALWRSVDTNTDLDNDDIQSFMTEPDFSKFGINTNLGLTLMLLLFVAALVVFYFVFKPIHGREFRTLSTTSSRLNWGKIFFAFNVWLGLSLFLEGISYLISPEAYTFNLQLNTFLPLLALAIFILPLQTSFEELFFRGYLMQGFGVMHLKHLIAFILSAVIVVIAYGLTADGLRTALMQAAQESPLMNLGTVMILQNLIFLIIFVVILSILSRVLPISSERTIHNYKLLPLIITSVLFGLVHSANPEVEKFGFGTMQIYYISAGLLLGIMTVMDDGLELALGTHAATNFTGAVFVGYDGAAINTDSLFKSHALDPQLMTIGFLVLASIFLIILKYKYAWESFSKLLAPIIKPDEDLVLQKFISDPTEDRT